MNVSECALGILLPVMVTGAAVGVKAVCRRCLRKVLKK